MESAPKGDGQGNEENAGGQIQEDSVTEELETGASVENEIMAIGTQRVQPGMDAHPSA